jgi:hypothetical protein
MLTKTLADEQLKILDGIDFPTLRAYLNRRLAKRRIYEPNRRCGHKNDMRGCPLCDRAVSRREKKKAN